MTLHEWAEAGWIRPHRTSSAEVGNLLGIVDRDLADAQGNISADWRFGIAYNAALKLCTVLLYASGYRPQRTEAHFRTLQALPLVLGGERQDDADYLETCRRKRNAVEYERAGGATRAEADELIAFVAHLKHDVMAWLQAHRRELLKHSGPGTPGEGEGS